MTPILTRLASMFCVLAAAVSLRAASPSDVAVTPLPDRIKIEIGGKLFTEYLFGANAAKPCLFPILTRDGTSLTRNWPMRDDIPSEQRDHPHHRGLWFGHGSVNGHDFWLENAKAGKIVHDAILETKSGATGVVRTRNRWVAPDGSVVCTDERTLRVQAVPQGTLLDFDITVHAGESPVIFGDTKEGTMSLRLNEELRLTRRQEKKNVPGTGHIVNSEGVKEGDTWGKPAKWVDYYGPLAGKTMGVAIFDHPKNPRHPTWWHVRDYGLFAANPFGKHDFENLKDQPKAGDFTIPAGGSATFRYRFYFHEGDTEAAKVAARYAEYAK